jgi:hypothetical protein
MEEIILEQCIQSVDNKELIRKAISKGWELDKEGEALRCKIGPTFYQKIMLDIE